MNVSECQDKKAWDTWLFNAQQSEFLQSWGWGEFQEHVGRKVMRLQVEDGEIIIGQVQGFIHELPFGIRYLYLPRVILGPWFGEVVEYIADKYKVMALRVEPTSSPFEISQGDSQMVRVSSRQPRHTLIVDLKQSETELLRAVHPKTRYNIHLAERKGVEVREGKDVDIFWKLNKETCARDHFKSHGKKYYEAMLRFPWCHQLTAWYQNIPIVSNLYISFNGICTYLHGASSSQFRNVMAPYAIQRRGMQMARQFGCHTYDLWGIAPPAGKIQDTNNKIQTTCFHNYCWDNMHALSSITQFKAGFGGKLKTYPEAFDVITKPLLYKLYTVAKRIRD